MNTLLQVINFLLAMTGFGITANPTPPTADAALVYAVPDADVIVHFDAVGVVPGNFKALKALPDLAEIKASKELRDATKKIVTEVEGSRAMVKGMIGLDLVTDINDVTAFVQRGAIMDQPNVLAAVHGTFAVASLAKLAKLTHGVISMGGTLVDLDGSVAVGLTKSGVLLVGTPSLVKPRMADGWQAPARTNNALLTQAADVINGKPFFAIMAALAPATRKQIASAVGKNFLTDAVKRHKFMALTLYADGIGWVWADTSKAGLDRMIMMSEGLIEIMRAAQVAPRGIGKIVLGALESYRGESRELDQLLAAQGKIANAITGYTGDGLFKVSQVVDGKNLRVTVRATGKTLSEVVPAALLVPTLAWGLFTNAASPPPPVIIEQSTPPARLPVPARRK